MTTAENGKKVKVQYTGKLESGDVFDSTEGKDPLEFTMGQGEMIPGFEKGILGMKIGDKKTISLTPEEGYGERRDDLVAEYDRSLFPQDIEITVGMHLQTTTETGEIIPLMITKIEGDMVTLDANHFLSGKTLVFEVELVSVS